MVLKIDVDPNEKFNKEINKAIKKIGDLTVPFKLMTAEWYKGNQSIFPEKRGNPGKYEDLSPKYKKAKIRAIGDAYPILRGFLKNRKSGKLAKSMINPQDAGGVSKIINKSILILGTKVVNKKGKPYPIYLHKGAKKIKLPARPFVLLGGEQVATSDINKRREIWIRRIKEYVLDSSKGFAK